MSSYSDLMGGCKERERQEIDYWRDSKTEGPGVDSLDAFTQKMSEARVFLEKMDEYADYFRAARTILELGGGQGWSACMIRRQFPGSTVVTTDIAPDAVASRGEWERVFKVRLTGASACRSYEIPFRDASLDLVVVFASAHHFGRHKRTLGELARVLCPGGHALYLHEPACSDYLYDQTVARVKRKRPLVQEDALRYKHLARIGLDQGLEVQVIQAPTTTNRGAVESIYYLGLQRFPPLQKMLPCSVDIILKRPYS